MAGIIEVENSGRTNDYVVRSNEILIKYYNKDGSKMFKKM
jgi:hypothetical protein